MGGEEIHFESDVDQSVFSGMFMLLPIIATVCACII